MTLTVLFVDDEPDLEPLLTLKYRNELANHDFIFAFAQNGIQALDVLKANTKINLMITDINMPDMDGMTLIKEAKLLMPTLKTAVLSAYDNAQNRSEMDQENLYAFIEKPIDFEKLTDVLARAQTNKFNLT